MRPTSIRFENLRAEMARNQITIKKMANEVGVNRDTMSGKLSGKRPLYLNEAFIINRTFFPNKDIPYLFKELLDN
jgi:DNA-binding XRE family transcriptional regulator